MKINKILVNNLLGLGNQEILLNPTTAVSILMGANGVGKSTLLSILHSCLTENWYRLGKIKFDSVELSYDDGSAIKIESDGDGIFVEIDGQKHQLEGIYGDIISTLESDGELIPLSCGHWSERGGSNHLTRKKIEEKYKPKEQNYPEHLAKYFRSEPSHLVSADRAFDVYEFDDNNYQRGAIHKKLKVQIKAEELLSCVNDAIKVYAARAQRIQSDIIKDLIGGELSPDSSMPHQDIERSFQQYKESVTQLTEIGVSEDVFSNMQHVTDRVNAANVDWILFALLERYNSILETSVLDITQKASRLFRFLEKALPSKEFRLDTNELRVISRINNSDIPLEKLSSGEQQLFILGYEILFACSKDSIVMIDEPELSMDPIMQADFAGFLDDTFASMSCRYLLATHSSLVIRGRHSSVQELTWSESP